MPRIYNAPPAVSAEWEAFMPAQPAQRRPAGPTGLDRGSRAVGQIGGIIETVAKSPLTGALIRGGQEAKWKMEDWAKAKLEQQRVQSEGMTDVDEWGQPVAKPAAADGAAKPLPKDGEFAPDLFPQVGAGSREMPILGTKRADDVMDEAALAAFRAGKAPPRIGPIATPQTAESPLYAERAADVARFGQAQALRTEGRESARDVDAEVARIARERLAAESTPMESRMGAAPAWAGFTLRGDESAPDEAGYVEGVARGIEAMPFRAGSQSAAEIAGRPAAGGAAESVGSERTIGADWRARGGAATLPDLGQPRPAPLTADERMAQIRAGIARPAATAAPAAPAKPRSLATITDAELDTVEKRLQAAAQAKPGDVLTTSRLKLVADERARRAEAAETPDVMTEAQWLSRARDAKTNEEQVKLLSQIDNVRTEISTMDDLLGSGPRDRLLAKAKSLFPALPTKTPEEQAAVLEVERAKAIKYLQDAGLAESKGRRLADLTDAELDNLLAQAGERRAGAKLKGAQTETEGSKQTELDARAGLHKERADDLAATRAARIGELTAKANELNARVAKLKRQAQMALRGGASDASIKKLAQELEVVTRTGKLEEQTASEEYRQTLDHTKMLATHAAQARAVLAKVPPPPDKPAPPTSSAPEVVASNARLQQDYSEKKKAWDRAHPEGDAALSALSDYQNAVSHADQLLQKRKEASELAKTLEPIKVELQRRLRAKLGIKPAEPAKSGLPE